MSVTDLRPKVRLLDQRAAKANLWSMGLWGISVVVLTCAVGVATWASFREPMDLVSVQIGAAHMNVETALRKVVFILVSLQVVY